MCHSQVHSTLKNTTLDSNKNVINKASAYIYGERAVFVYEMLRDKRQKSWGDDADRLFHRVCRKLTLDLLFWFEKAVENSWCGCAVSKYTTILLHGKQIKPGQYSNMSIPKTHTQVLNKALLPPSVQHSSYTNKQMY